MYKNLTKLVEVIDNTEEEEVVIIDANGEERLVRKQVSPNEASDNTETLDESQKQESQEQENDDLISPETKQTLEDVSAKAITAAKERGDRLYTVGKHATEMVAEKAKEISRSVEEKTLLGDFTKEQGKLAVEQMELDKLSEVAVPLWVGYNEEETMESHIYAILSQIGNKIVELEKGIQYMPSTQPSEEAEVQEEEFEMKFETIQSFCSCTHYQYIQGPVVNNVAVGAKTNVDVVPLLPDHQMQELVLTRGTICPSGFTTQHDEQAISVSSSGITPYCRLQTRLDSYQENFGHPDFRLYAQEMAEAGFYLELCNRAMCYACRAVIENLNTDDIQGRLLAQHLPRCSHARKMKLKNFVHLGQ